MHIKINSVILTTIFIVAVFVAPAHAQHPVDESKVTSLSQYWQTVFQKSLGHVAVGYSYAIYKNGNPIAVGASGYAIAPNDSLPDGLAMTMDTRMQIASCSKPITAVALLHGLEEKGLNPDMPMWPLIIDSFEVLGKGVEEITIKNLLTHHSGFDFGYIETPLIENARLLLSNPVPNKPGESYQYSNINTSLARIVLEILSGKDYESYIREYLLIPAGINGMKLKVDADEVAWSYDYSGDPEIGAPITYDFTDEAAAYGWYATANELAVFLRFVQTNRYLSEDATAAMLENELGWGKSKLPSGYAYRHDGQWIIENNVGVRTGMGIFPDDVEAVILINTNGPFFPGTILMDGFRDCYPRVTYAVNHETNTASIHISIPPFAEEIRWTSDGTEPTIHSNLLNGPINIAAPVTIKCKGFVRGEAVTFTTTKVIGN